MASRSAGNTLLTSSQDSSKAKAFTPENLPHVATEFQLKLMPMGLCPGIHQSNGRGREGCINRCGNPVVRYLLIEMVWRLLRWQPDYPPIQKLRRTVSKRGKRWLVVAAARRLAIDLWRLATGRATAEDLGLQLQPPMAQKPSV
jgi:hypothetical protein